MPVQIRHTTWCSICNNSHDAAYHQSNSALEAPSPVLPEGWTQIDGQTICPRHRVKVSITTPRSDLYCPECGWRHIDETPWDDVPHREHKCAKCNYVWAPADFNTVGVA